MSAIQTIAFETSKLGQFGASGTGKRETVDDREVKAEKLLASNPVTYIGQLGKVYGTALAEGKGLPVCGVVLSTQEPNEGQPHQLACCICGKTHGKPTKNDVKAGKGWKADRLALLHLVSQNGKPFILSDSCVENYFLPAATAKNVTNFADVIRHFGLVAKK
jgi:hypothetical protein